MSLNWQNLRTWDGSQNKAFEELCCQLAECEPVRSGSKFIRVGTPDAGVECYWRLDNGDEWGWQAKFFLKTPGSGEWQQIDESVKRALEKHPRLTRYTVCLPIDRPDPRIPGQEWLMDKWNQHIEKWSLWASEKGMSVEFEYWGEHEIVSRLSLGEQCGRYYFWFNKETFSQNWFELNVSETISNAGPRYTPELNVELPVAQLFEGLGRTSEFFTEMRVLRGNLVRAFAKLRRARSTDSAKEAFDRLFEGIDRLLPLLVQAEEADTQQIDIKGLVALASESRKQAFDCDRQLRMIQEEARKSGAEGSRASNASVPKGEKSGEDFGYLFHHLNDLMGTLSDTVNFFESKGAELANVGALLLVGNAGTGKTHLFCDVAKQRIAAGLPTVLLLGQHFAASEPWSQIFQLLAMKCTKEELLGALEAAAQARGGRALILIDALNEGEGKDIWHKCLAGILTTIRRFPRIGIAISVRSSYANLLIPAGLGANNLITATHHGFADYEYEATKTFFDHFRIERPSVPLLYPEFQNPMFLKLFCQGLKNRGLTRFPSGLRGVTSIFGFFLESVNAKLARAEFLDYDESTKPVIKAVERFSQALADEKARWLPREEARTLLDGILPREGYEKSLCRHLISEGVFSIDRFWSGQNNHYEEGIQLSYERLTDFLAAQVLLHRHLNHEDPAKSFLPLLGLYGGLLSPPLCGAHCKGISR